MVTDHTSQISIYPYALRKISVLTELILGHLCYHLTDVPPQPNSPPDCVNDQAHTEVFNAIIDSYESLLTNHISKTASRVGVSHGRLRSPLCCTSTATSQSLTRVKLNRVFFPRHYTQARSLGCGFTV